MNMILNNILNKRYALVVAGILIFELIIGIIVIPGHQGAFISFYLLNAVIALCAGLACYSYYFTNVSESFDSGIKLLLRNLLRCLIVAALIELCTVIGSRSSYLPYIFDFNIKRFAIFAYVVFCIQTGLKFFSKEIILCKNQIYAFFRTINWKLIIAVVIMSLLSALVVSPIAESCHISHRVACVFSFCALSCLGTLIVFFRAKLPLECIFSVVALFAGFALIFSFPASNLFSWDDEIHYKKALSLSYVSDVETTASDEALLNLLTVEPGFQHSASFDRFPLSETSNWSQDTIYQFENELNRNAASDTTKIEPGVSEAVTTVVSAGYIPSAIGLWIGRLIHLPFVWTFALGRLANLLFYVAVIAFAISIIPCKKTIICVIALLPTSLFLASNYSYDPWVISLTILGFSLFVKSLTSDCSNPWKLAICSIFILTIAFLAKAVYFPILALWFLGFQHVRNCCSYGRKAVLCISVLCGIFLIISFMLPMLVSAPGADGDLRGGSNVSSSGQIAYILSHPFEYIKMLIRYLVTSYLPIANQENAMTNLAYLGSLNERFPFVTGLMSIFLICVALLDSGNAANIRIGVSDKLWTFAIIFAVLGLIASALYVSFTPVGYHTIEGVQARYMLPLYPLALGLLCNSQHYGIDTHKLGFSAVCISGIILFNTYWVLLGSRIIY